MTTFEMVEQLRMKANVSYEEAKAALEHSNWDLLDAIVLLEKQGKIQEGTAANYSTKKETKADDDKANSRRVQNAFGRIGRTLVRWVDYGCRNVLEISRKGEVLVSIPLLAIIILALFAFVPVIIALIVGLFFGFHYALRGPGIKSEAVNSAIDKASEMADNLKRDIQNGHDEHTGDND